MDIINPKISQYVYDHTKPESALLEELISKTKAELEYSTMLSGRVEGQFLSMLVKLTGAKNVLELGMFTGFSALTMAQSLPDDGIIITCDMNEYYARIAQSFFDRSSHGKKINVRLGKAKETLQSLSGPFDLVFIDADKQNYPEYYELVLPMMPSGGLIVIDNALWSGSVLEPDGNEALAIDNLNKKILSDDRVENVMLTVRDGIHLVRKI
ncbi:MAG: class I SAM-dependent methyltransferase [Balneolales bacterium]